MIDADIKDNPSSIFGSLGTDPKRFFLKNQMDNIHPKVRIREHVIYPIDLGMGAVDVVATKDSIGTKLYYEEYSDGVGPHPVHLAWVKSGVNTGAHCPIRFEKVVPLSDDDYVALKQNWLHIEVSCRVGATRIVPTASFVVIGRKEFG